MCYFNSSIGWRMQGWLKGQSHILKTAIMVLRKRLPRAIAATFWPRGWRALRARRPRGPNVKNNLRSLPRRNQSLRQGVARRNHVRNAQKRTHKYPLASRKKPEPKPKSPTANKTWTHRGIRHQGAHQTRSPISNTIRAPYWWNRQGNQWREKGKNLEGIEETTGSQLWMDDVLLISTDPNELQDMLNITNEIWNCYHIEFGKEKRKILKIWPSKKMPTIKLGEMTLEYINKYKYLGETLNEKANLETHIQKVKGKVEAAYQTILSIAGSKQFRNTQMEAIKTVVEACIIPIITYAGETRNPIKQGKNITKPDPGQNH